MSWLSPFLLLVLPEPLNTGKSWHSRARHMPSNGTERREAGSVELPRFARSASFSMWSFSLENLPSARTSGRNAAGRRADWLQLRGDAVLEDAHRLRAEDFRVPAGGLLQIAARHGDVGDVKPGADRRVVQSGDDDRPVVVDVGARRAGHHQVAERAEEAVAVMLR